MHGCRILVWTPGLNGADGISSVARQAVRALTARGKERPWGTEVWSLTDGPLGALGETGSVLCRCASGSKVRFVRWALQATARSGRDTLVVALHIHLAPVALPLMARGARLALYLHGIEAWRRPSLLERAALRRAWVLMANSHHTAARFMAANPGHESRRVRICHPTVPVESTSRTSRGPAGAPFALIVGRMAAEERYKGHDLLLELWPTVVAEFPEARLLVVGDGDDRARLESKAAALGMRESVPFLGRMSDEALADLYHACSFFVMPSTGEGFGLVFLEAMRAGKACIGGVGAAEEIIEDGVTGLVVDPDRADHVLGAVLRLFREPETRAGMGRAGAARIAREFTEARFRRSIRMALGLEGGPGSSSVERPTPSADATSGAPGHRSG